MISGELRTAFGTIELNAGRETIELTVLNTGDRPIQVGSHFHFADVNTDLWLEVEEDRCIGGDEAVFGGGKTIRESMLQGNRTSAQGAPDTVITNVVVLDHWGVIRCDVGIREGPIVALGKAGNPDIADGVHPDLQIGPTTDIIAGEGRILTAGGIDCHLHFICPQLVDTAIASGITTMVGGGTGPSEGTRATTCTPSPRALHEMLLALDATPVNVLLLGKGNTVSSEGLIEQLRAGAGGLKVHEDWARPPPRSTAACRSPTRPACRSRSTPARSTRPATCSRRSRRGHPGARAHRRGANRLLPAHRDPRRHHDQPRGRRGARA